MNVNKLETVAVCTGYLPGSKLNKYDCMYDREEKYSFDNILIKQLKHGAVPIWETYRVFVVDGMVFGTVIVDTSKVDEDWSMPILTLEYEINLNE